MLCTGEGYLRHGTCLFHRAAQISEDIHRARRRGKMHRWFRFRCIWYVITYPVVCVTVVEASSAMEIPAVTMVQLTLGAHIFESLADPQFCPFAVGVCVTSVWS
ncbi:hypothetical protein CY34DRAFT_628900 [Suillus luteus UH-Slu-Lm8-n1]|uniref:Uncharacterized protein n=1 Tax=Suillus luteus UH-Slu-Lm8-n1 TaxID=930992 RepID=A0A0D0AEA2_9AGAM|nr:hypothetical protein CY34DRAFT_628900 [Suillus luteus UH-Slu-Lm8-n1]